MNFFITLGWQGTKIVMTSMSTFSHVLFHCWHMCCYNFHCLCITFHCIVGKVSEILAALSCVGHETQSINGWAGKGDPSSPDPNTWQSTWFLSKLYFCNDTAFSALFMYEWLTYCTQTADYIFNALLHLFKKWSNPLWPTLILIDWS